MKLMRVNRQKNDVPFWVFRMEPLRGMNGIIDSFTANLKNWNSRKRSFINIRSLSIYINWMINFHQKQYNRPGWIQFNSNWIRYVGRLKLQVQECGCLICERILIEVVKYGYLRCDVFNFAISRSIKSLEWWNWEDERIVLAPVSIDVQLLCLLANSYFLIFYRSFVLSFFSFFLLFNEIIKSNGHNVQVVLPNSILFCGSTIYDVQRECAQCSNGQTNFYCVCARCPKATLNDVLERVSVCLDKGGKWWWSRYKL